MSADVFGNSPAMTHDEMLADGLIDDNDEYTSKGLILQAGPGIKMAFEAITFFDVETRIFLIDAVLMDTIRTEKDDGDQWGLVDLLLPHAEHLLEVLKKIQAGEL